MQGYFLKLLGNNRSHMYAEGSGPGFNNGYTSAGPPLPLPSAARSSPRGLAAGSGLQQEGSSSSVGGASAARGEGSGRHTPSSSMGQDDSMKGYGHWFDHAGLVASHR